GREGHEETTQQGGEKPKGPGTHSEESCFQATQKRNDGRVVDVTKRWVPARVQVVELVGMETESAVGRQVNGNDDCRDTSEKERGGETEALPAVRCVQAERRGEVSSSRIVHGLASCARKHRFPNRGFRLQTLEAFCPLRASV